jgi:hypothetical protein
MNLPTTPTLLLLGCALCLGATGCSGELRSEALTKTPGPGEPGPGGGGGQNNDPDPDPDRPRDRSFACDDDAVAPEQPLRRLSMEQYRFTVHDFVEALTPSPAALADADDVAARMPDDRPIGAPNDTHGGYRRLDQALQQAHVDVALEVGASVGAALTADADAMRAALGDCATDADADNDDACVEGFIRRAGRLAHRRDLTDDDVAFYQGVYAADGISPAGVRDVVTVMMSSPQFLYHVEHGAAPDPAGGPDAFSLDAYEAASRLSFHFWQSMPDAELLDLAASGALLDPEVWAAQVDRVYADPKTARSLERFVHEWLWADEVPELNGLTGTPRFDTFAGEAEPSADLRERMIDELTQMGRYYMWSHPGSFQEMFASDRSFATHPELADLYGLPAWDGEGEPPQFLEDQRRGVFTRAALLSTGTTSTRPIMKGFFVRKALMCTTPPPPDENAADAMLEITDDMTTREIVVELTEQPGTTCAGCHLTYINDLGFPTESFDALGRWRTEEMLFDDDGNLYGTKAVDTSGHPMLDIGTQTPVDDAADLTDALLANGQLEGCFARQYVRFTFGRVEDLERDGCALESLRTQLAAGATLPEVFKSLALRPEFTRRVMTDAQGE